MTRMFPNSSGGGYCEGNASYLGTQHPVYVPSSRAVLGGLGSHQYNHAGKKIRFDLIYNRKIGIVPKWNSIKKNLFARKRRAAGILFLEN